MHGAIHNLHPHRKPFVLATCLLVGLAGSTTASAAVSFAPIDGVDATRRWPASACS